VSRWTHADGTAEHEPDPHYNGNGLPAFWTCHVKDCGRKLRLDGFAPPITVSRSAVPVTPTDSQLRDIEPPLSAQP
jgi:hypothetical protein